MAMKHKVVGRHTGPVFPFVVLGLCIVVLSSCWLAICLINEPVLSECKADSAVHGNITLSIDRSQTIWVYLTVPYGKSAGDYGLVASQIRHDIQLQLDSDILSSVGDSYQDAPGSVMLAKGHINGSKHVDLHWNILSGKPLPANWSIVVQSPIDYEAWLTTMMILKIFMGIATVLFVVTLFLLLRRVAKRRS
jgi:hypothetical protein